MLRRAASAGFLRSLRRGVPGRVLLVLLLLYVTVDVCNPFVRGAFEFSPSDSVDGLCRLRQHVTESPAALVEPLAGRRDAVAAAASRVVSRPVPSRRPDPGRPVARSRSAVRDSAPPGSDDH